MNIPTQSDWQAKAAALRFPHQAFVDGKHVDALSGATFDALSPIDGAVLAKVARCDGADVDRAVQVARRAFESGHWSDTKPTHRKKVLVKFAQLIHEHREELALLEALDMGKHRRWRIECRCRRQRALHELDRRSDRQGLRRSRATGPTSSVWSRASRWVSSAPSCRGISRC
jgi:acyl-CoA reductase-like NAD-dependent aldehyde dehydrogenase